MNLSDAMRATTRPQLYGTWIKRRYNCWVSELAVCPLAGAFETGGLLNLSSGLGKWPGVRLLVAKWKARWRWPILRIKTACPACACSDCTGSYNVFRIVLHLNDDHQWSRNQIADWLAEGEQIHKLARPALLDESRKLWAELRETTTPVNT